jgi:methionyl-tRNA synthetase
MHKYYNGTVPEIQGTPSEAEQAAATESRRAYESVGKAIEQFKFREALAEAMNIARAGNKLLTETEPWKLMKTDPQATARILHACLNMVADAAAALSPFLPFTSDKLVEALQIKARTWDEVTMNEQIATGHTIGQLPILFEKITDDTVAAQVEKLAQRQAENTATVEPIKDTIDFETFQKLDLRVVKVLAAEAVPKTKKLLKLTIDTGVDKRTVVSGIAEHYTPEDVIGKHVLFLANLAPRSIKGVESAGMILMAENPQGQLSILSTEREAITGSTVK